MVVGWGREEESKPMIGNDEASKVTVGNAKEARREMYQVPSTEYLVTKPTLGLAPSEGACLF